MMIMMMMTIMAIILTTGGVYIPTYVCLYGKGKGKVHLCTGTEALYRPYGPQGE